jgi:hypothetical protein
MLMSGIWIAAAVAAALWAKWRKARNVLERKHCQQLLAKFQAAKHLEASPPGM